MQCQPLRRSLLIPCGSVAAVLSMVLLLFAAGCPFGPNNTPDDPGDPSPGQPQPPDPITVPIEGQGAVEQKAVGSFIQLTAIPASGWQFDAWFGTTNSSRNPITISPSESTSLNARFVEIQGEPDGDGDGVADSADNCPDVANSNQADDDSDGIGNACDNCRTDVNMDQADEDEDGKGDACDNCPDDANTTQADTDADGLGNVCDNCPTDANAAQTDTDNDGTGDACDDCPFDANNDSDGDGVCDDIDQCPSTPADEDVDDRGCPVCEATCDDGVVECGEECDPPDGVCCDDECQLIPGGAPANDQCNDSINVGDGDTSFTTCRADTDGPDEPSVCALGGEYSQVGSDIWYCYAATCAGVVTASLCDSDFDTKMAVYAGCGCPASGAIECDDDSCGAALGSVVEFSATTGESYLIRVGGWSADQGEGTMTIDCVPVCETDTDCDDDLYCNGEETCDAQSGCQPGTSPCSGNEECDEVDDRCIVACTSDGDCDDGQFCNGVETCVGGACEAGTIVDCSDEVDCTDDTCDDVVGCAHTPNDANCDDVNVCTDDVCDADTDCAHTNNTDACDDGDACTENDVCADGACVSGAAKDCDDDNACTDDSCDPDTGCLNPNNTDPCDDSDACTEPDVCANGACSGTAIDCSDGDPCTNDVCTDGVCSNPAIECDDGDLCTVDACVGGVCENVPVDCDDGVDCTVDGCDGATGNCTNTPDDAICDNENFCDGEETCDPVSDCQTGADPCPGQQCNEPDGPCVECTDNSDCDDGFACTFDICANGVTCVNQVDPSYDCDDRLHCTGEEFCDVNFGCVSQGDPCDDGIDCTLIECDEENDQCAAVETTADPCPDDGLFCNGVEFCDPVLDCISGAIPCVAGQVCNEDIDACETDPVTWISTQLLLWVAEGYSTPEMYDTDIFSRLALAHVNVTEEALEDAFDGDATVLATDIPLGQATAVYRIVSEPFPNFPEVTLTETHTLTINEFHLAFAMEGEDIVATWTFDFTATKVEVYSSILEDRTIEEHYIGSQTGPLSGDGLVITWEVVDGTRQECTDGACGGVFSIAEWLIVNEVQLGTWTKQQ